MIDKSRWGRQGRDELDRWTWDSKMTYWGSARGWMWWLWGEIEVD